MDKATPWIAGLFGLAAIGGVVLAGERAAGAAAAPTTPQGAVGEGTPLQSRPIPAWGTLTADGQVAYLDTERQQLQFLADTFGDSGFAPGPAASSSTADPAAAAAALAAATRYFAANNAARVAAYGYAAGGDAGTNLVAVMNAIDDAARDAFPSGAAPQAADYRAPAPPPSGLGATTTSGAVAGGAPPGGDVRGAMVDAFRTAMGGDFARGAPPPPPPGATAYRTGGAPAPGMRSQPYLGQTSPKLRIVRGRGFDFWAARSLGGGYDDGRDAAPAAPAAQTPRVKLGSG